MATRVEMTDVLIPAGTAIGAPVTVPVTFNEGTVDRIEQHWPPGPSGLVGLRIGHSGQVLIPYQVNTWLKTDAENLGWDVSGFPTGQAWFVQGYNTDVNDHTIQIRWLITDPGDGPTPQPALVPITAG